MKPISCNLKEVRNELGLTQKDAAEAMGVKVQVYQRYESGKQTPGSDKIILFANNLKVVNIHWLLTGNGSMYLHDNTNYHPHAPQNLDINILTGVIEGVEQGCSLSGLHLDPDLKAKMISILYDHFVKTGEKPDINTCQQYLKLVS
jgi:transcriptional regulator with XRE-family HTH domain